MRKSFEQLALVVCAAVPGVDRISLYLEAESSSFIRFNHARVRQATQVEQAYGTVSVYRGLRRAQGTLTLTGIESTDLAALMAEREALVTQLDSVPDDSHLLLPDTVISTEHVARGSLPSADELIAAVVGHAGDADLVGFYAGGSMVRAFADSRGQRNWHEVDSFHFDWCLYRRADEAVKTSYSGTHWNESEFARRMAQARTQFDLLALPRKTLQPGPYRAWLSPGAVADLLGILGWGGFGLRSARTGVSSLVLLHQGKAAFDRRITLTEATQSGIAPRFQSDGFVKPDQVALVRDGQLADLLASPRSAREYGVAANGANADEAPESLSIAAGDLQGSEVLQRLGTGLYIEHVHYLNYSDRRSARVTGMTRFACFWVEDGKFVAPLNVMRFDDSLLRMFGPGLVALSDRAELIPDNASYGSRRLASVTAPGAIIDGFRFTL